MLDRADLTGLSSQGLVRLYLPGNYNGGGPGLLGFP
jgi:hypothetical protein